MRRLAGKFQPIITAACLAVLTACGANTAPLNVTPAQTACTGNQAMIGVGDGYLVNYCGCGGTAGQVITPPQTLTCNVSAAGVGVFFDYLGTQNRHQIAPSISSALSFATSPLSDPTDRNPIRVHAVLLSTSGTYSFVDLFNSGVQGSIVVP